MPRLVPSEIVRVIDALISYARAPKKPEPMPLLNVGVNGRVSAIIALIDRLPDELVTLTPSEFADYITQLEILRTKNNMAEQRGAEYTYSGEPIWQLRRLLAKCPDETPAEAEHDLLFIDHPGLRTDLRIDLAEAYNSLHAGRWKAATDLGGAIIEALLVWRLSKLSETEREAAIAKLRVTAKNRPDGSPHDWWFWQLIEVAAAAGVIDEDPTAKQVRIAKDFRNLIHPGVTQRTGERCGKDTALGALAGVERVILDLAKAAERV